MKIEALLRTSLGVHQSKHDIAQQLPVGTIGDPKTRAAVCDAVEPLLRAGVHLVVAGDTEDQTWFGLRRAKDSTS